MPSVRTLTIHTADELVTRWKAKAHQLDLDADANPVRTSYLVDTARAQAYRVCAAELAAIVAVSMELEAAHHGDPEVDRFASDDAEDADAANALMDWSQGRRP